MQNLFSFQKKKLHNFLLNFCLVGVTALLSHSDLWAEEVLTSFPFGAGAILNVFLNSMTRIQKILKKKSFPFQCKPLSRAP